MFRFALTPYTVALVAAGFVQTALAAVSLRYRHEQLSRLLSGLLAATAVWCLAYAMQLSAPNATDAAFWNNVRLLGPTLVSPLVFLFAASYTDRERWLRRPRVATLFIVPAATNALVWIDGLDHLVRRAIATPPNGGLYTEVAMGPWAYVYATYNYVLFAAAVGMFVLAFRARWRDATYRGQLAAILVGAVVPGVGNLLHFLDLAVFDPTPFGFAVTGIMFAIALYRYRLLDLLPIARSTVFENVDSGVLVLDPDGEVVDANERAAAILEIPVDGLVGTAVDDLIAGQRATLEQFADALHARERVEFAVDGGTRWYDVSISPIYNSTDRYVGRVVMFDDVTDQVERQRELERRSQELERQNEHLEEVASIVSHDLRNPLNVIEGHLQLARETGGSHHHDVIERNVDRMDELITEMLTMARQGRTVTDSEPVELSDVAGEAWSHVHTTSATLENDVSITVTADRSRLLQLFENLFRNALDHGPDDVVVRIGDWDDGFFVEDDGPGVPPDDRDAVFDRGHTTAEDGTGLGLAIVKTIVDAHGWAIRVTEGSRGGARFEVRTE